jgi:hypothetical protein
MIPPVDPSIIIEAELLPAEVGRDPAARVFVGVAVPVGTVVTVVNSVTDPLTEGTTTTTGGGGGGLFVGGWVVVGGRLDVVATG